MEDNEDLRTGPQSTMRRKAGRGTRDRAQINAVIDEALLCHVAFVENDWPVVIPATPWRDGTHVYFHGALHGRLIRVIAAGQPVSVSFAFVDSLILAGSAMAHSNDFRSVVLFGRGEAVTEPAEKRRVLDLLLEKLSPGRSAQVRPPTEAELGVTGVVRLAIEEGNAKLRDLPPVEEEGDAPWPAWIGRVPLRLTAGPFEAVGERSRHLPEPRLPAWLPRQPG